MLGVSTITCQKCQEHVQVIFTKVTGLCGIWWEGRCPRCGAPNQIRKPGWTKEVPQTGGQN